MTERPSLNPDLIVETALRLARGTSPGELSFRSLGRELGADHTAVYRHFDSKAQLLAIAKDRLLERGVQALPQGLGWRERLRTAAIAYIDGFAEHPLLALETSAYQATGGPGELATMELTVGCLLEAGLPPEDAADFYVLVVSFLPAMAATIAARQLGRAAPPSWPQKVEIDAASYPALQSIAYLGATLSPRDATIHGIDLILESAARRADDIRSAPPR